MSGADVSLLLGVEAKAGDIVELIADQPDIMDVRILHPGKQLAVLFLRMGQRSKKDHIYLCIGQ